MQEAVDLLKERAQGSSARSAGHNARLVLERALRAAPPAPVADGSDAASQIIGEIEQRFPNWRSYRDLIDCIDCTLHDLRSRAAEAGR